VPSRVDEILAEMRNNPTGVRFADACKVATHYFGEPRHNGTSHKIWKMPWPGDPRINMQVGNAGKAKPYQVRQAVTAIGLLIAQQVAPMAASEQPKPSPSKQKKRRR
jgi:hypothetical protein